ncbi:hypothetical protein GCM10009716_12330 [Streptomyces sodiiphilus]|uniref:Uncharacterized protein n=1 Tax=Streptomyces sodiiphilus TaxID=226217 RepID=A0ABN2NVZ1_9ACTN
MPTYEQLYHLSLSSLAEAVEDWRVTARALGELAEEARTGMLAKSRRADWAGANADVSRPFVITTALQFRYAEEKALGIHRLLEDLYEAQHGYRDALRKLEEDARQLGLRIEPDGRVVVRSEFLREGTAEETGYQRAQEATHGLASRVEAVLTASAEADATIARALYELVGDDHSRFSPGTHGGLESAEAEQGRAAVREAVELLEKTYLTDSELGRLRDLLERQRNNEYFAVHLADTLGPEGLVQFWSRMMDEPRHPDLPGGERLDVLRDVREFLGVALGEATRSDLPAMNGWQERLFDVAGDPVAPGDPLSLRGFQVISDLLNHGDYNEDFLVAYGAALVDFEKRDPEAALWREPTGMGLYETLLHDEVHYDPMTGLMKAMSRQPEAATEFFGVTEPQDYAKHVMEREYGSPGGEAVEGSGFAAREAIGEAMAAAAMGSDPNVPNSVPAETGSAHAEVRDRLLSIGYGLGNDFPPEFRVPMARIFAHHSGEVFETARTYSGSDLPIHPRHLAGVNAQIARDPDAYRIVQVGMIPEYVEWVHGDETGEPHWMLDDVGRSIGFLEYGRHAALEIDKDDSSWTGKNFYNLGSAVLGDFPYVGTQIQHGLDQATSRWVAYENGRAAAESESQRNEYYDEGNVYLNVYATQWTALNPEPPEGYSMSGDIWTSEVAQALREAANDGVKGARSNTPSS